MYFGPGIHKIGPDGTGTLILHDHETVYIDGGAILFGKISAIGAKDITIAGHGILSGEMFTDHTFGDEKLITIDNSTNVNISGITLLNSVSWNVVLYTCSNVVCDNLKIVGYGTHTDGIDPVCSSQVMIKNCYIRNYDDGISIKLAYGIGGSSNSRGSHGITVQDCIFWTDQGRSVLIGPESFSNSDKTYDNIIIKNIDVLYCENYNADWAKGVLAINLGDEATAKDIIFEDIRVDKLGKATNLISLSILQSVFNVSPGQSIQNITFNRISLNTSLNSLDNYIWGYDSDRSIDGVHFIDLKIDGQYIKDATEGRFDINPFASYITFETTK